MDIDIYGRQPVIEALRSGHQVEKIWLARNISGRVIPHIKNLANNNKVELVHVDKNDLQKIVGAVVHQGVAARVRYSGLLSQIDLENLLAEKANPFLLILDQVQDPHNLGAIIRTAEIAGVDGLVIAGKGSARINATVAKTSAGALFNIKIFQAEILDTVFEELQAKGIKIYATTPGSGRSIYQAEFSTGLAVVIGSEGQGVRKNLLRLCDERLTIPQFGRTNSLNASVSTAIVLYEVVRQRHFADQPDEQENG